MNSQLVQPCPKCGRRNPLYQKVCPECNHRLGSDMLQQSGTTTGQACPMCGAVVSDETEACPECGEWISNHQPEPFNKTDMQRLRQFRREMTVLAGFWIFFGVSYVFATLMLLTGGPVIQRQFTKNGLMIFVGLGLVLGVAWIVCGIASAYKRLWAIYVGLVASYISLLGSLLQSNLCGLILLIFLIVKAHRSLKLGKQLLKADVPLTFKP